MVEKQLEQGEVGTGENHLLAVAVEQAVADHVQTPGVEADHLGLALLTEADPAQQGLDPGLQLAGAEGLADVVIGAQLQADDPVGLVGAGGEHDDRHLGQARVFAHPAAEAEAVLVGQHHVEDRQVGTGLVHGGTKARAIGHGAHLEAGAAEEGLQQFANFLVVIHQEDVLSGRAHVGRPLLLSVMSVWMQGVDAETLSSSCRRRRIAIGGPMKRGPPYNRSPAGNVPRVRFP